MINTISSIMPLAAEYSLDQNGSIVIWSFAILSAIIFLLTFLSDKWKDGLRADFRLGAPFARAGAADDEQVSVAGVAARVDDFRG